MREIEFRGLRTDTNEWVYGYYVAATASQLDINDVPLAEARICRVIVVDGYFFHIETESAGQYTGLKDKNGVKIFEGDVLSYGYWNSNIEFGLCLHEVYFSDGAFISKELTNPDENIDGLGIDESQCEIIGNIHQNPELLK